MRQAARPDQCSPIPKGIGEQRAGCDAQCAGPQPCVLITRIKPLGIFAAGVGRSVGMEPSPERFLLNSRSTNVHVLTATVSAVMPSARNPDPESRTRIGERRRTVSLAVSSLTLATRATVRALVLTVPVTKPRHSRHSAPAQPVAECGKCDTGLAQGNRLIPAEMDQVNGLPEDPLKPAQGQGSSSPETTTAHSHDLTP